MRYISAITFFLRTTLAHHWELEKSIYSPVWSSLLLQKGGFWMIEFDAMAWKKQKNSIMNQRATSIRFPVRTHVQTTRVYFVHHGLFLASLLERFLGFLCWRIQAFITAKYKKYINFHWTGSKDIFLYCLEWWNAESFFRQARLCKFWQRAQYPLNLMPDISQTLSNL